MTKSIGSSNQRKQKVMVLSSSPITKGNSGYYALKAGKSSIYDLLAVNYDVKPFFWSKRANVNMNLKRVYLLDGFQILGHLFNFLLKYRFDVILTTGMPVLESVPTFFFAKMMRIPIIIKETHWYWPNKLASKLIWPINKIMIFNSDLVVCPGKRAYMYWQTLGLPENKIKIVPFYASLLEETPKSREEAIRLREQFKNNLILLCFGRLIKKKGVDYLIEAFALLSKDYTNLVLVIAGDGPEKHNLEKLCETLHLSNVVFTGAPEEDVKPAYFQICDIYVYPSIMMELPEEWPLGVVEAMSLSKPVVVTTAVGSAPDVVKEGVNGYIVPDKNHTALYITIKYMIENEAIRKKMGQASFSIIKNGFTYDYVTQGLDHAIKIVTKKE